jgi:hypothetical protein
VVSHGKSLHSKHSLTPLLKAQLQIWHILFSLATQPTVPLGQVPFCIRGHFSQAIPQTPIFMFSTLSDSYVHLAVIKLVKLKKLV